MPFDNETQTKSLLRLEKEGFFGVEKASVASLISCSYQCPRLLRE